MFADVESFKLPSSVTNIHSSGTPDAGGGPPVLVATTECLYVLHPVKGQSSCRLATVLRVSSRDNMSVQCIAVLPQHPGVGDVLTLAACFVPRTPGLLSTLAIRTLHPITWTTDDGQHTEGVWEPGTFELPYTPILLCRVEANVVVVSGADGGLRAYRVDHGRQTATECDCPDGLASIRAPSAVIALHKQVGGTWVVGCVDGTVMAVRGGGTVAFHTMRCAVSAVWALPSQSSSHRLVVAEAAGHVHIVGDDNYCRALVPPRPEHFASGVSCAALCPWANGDVDVIIGTLSGAVLRYDGCGGGHGAYTECEVAEVADAVCALHVVDVNLDGLCEVVATCQRSVAVVYFSMQRVVARKLLPMLE